MGDSFTEDDYKLDVALPPGNFHIWPMTRIGAITIDVVVAIIFIILWFLPRRVYRTDHICDPDDGGVLQNVSTTI